MTWTRRPSDSVKFRPYRARHRRVWIPTGELRRVYSGTNSHLIKDKSRPAEPAHLSGHKGDLQRHGNHVAHVLIDHDIRQGLTGESVCLDPQ